MTGPTYDGKALFASGPARIEAGGAALRFAEHEPVAGDGASVHAQGRQARPITQTGSLTADTLDDLHTQRHAIEAYIDGIARELVDEHGHAWPHVVMLRFEPAAPRRLGTRWQTGYRIDYRQLRP